MKFGVACEFENDPISKRRKCLNFKPQREKRGTSDNGYGEKGTDFEQKLLIDRKKNSGIKNL